MITNLIFDMDDTLCECSPYYAKCKKTFIAQAHERTDVPVEVIKQILTGIDVACTSLPSGFGKERYPRSFAAASSVLDIIRGLPVDSTAAEQAYLLGDSVFNESYPLFDGVIETLQRLRKSGYRLFLYTKGDYEMQWKKITKNKLDTIFATDHIYVVPKKDGTALTKIVTDHRINVKESLMIGDSIRDDIGSANEIGMLSVLVDSVTKAHWEFENADHVPSYKVKKMTDIELMLQPHF